MNSEKVQAELGISPEELQVAQEATGKKKQRSKSQKKAADRQRVFATVVYPESAPTDWLEKLDELHVAALISPLHDKDVNPDGTPKKAHYHVMLIFDGVKAFDTQVKPIFDSIGGVGREIINSQRGYARYLCHLDNPEKHQYDRSEVREMGGACYDAIIHIPTDDLRMLSDMLAFIHTNNICSFAEMVDICRVQNMDWFNLIVTSRAYVVDKYIKSMQWENKEGYVRQYGEEV